LFTSLTVCEKALGSGQEYRPQTVEYVGDIVVAHVNPATGLAHPLQATNDREVLLVVFQINPQDALFLVLDEFVVLDIAFILEQLGKAQFDFGGRNINPFKPCCASVANAG
jgi:hypothetical protein